nr:unnamed protein product [Callosobruchus chinensis]
MKLILFKTVSNQNFQHLKEGELMIIFEVLLPKRFVIQLQHR